MIYDFFGKFMINTTIDSIIFPHIKICQPAKNCGFRFGSDSLLLSYFANIKKGSLIADVGSGSGIISVLVSLMYQSKVTAIEIQEEMFYCLQKTISLCNLENSITAINADIKNFKNRELFDGIICNPPYRKIGTGKLSNTENSCKARFSSEMDLNILMAFAKQNLKYGGKIYFSYDADMASEAFLLCISNNFEPKRLRFVYPSPNKNAKLLLMECVFGGGREIKIEPPLFQNSNDNTEYENIFKGLWQERNL